MSFEFVIEDGVSIPKREIEFAPRGSQYPLEQMKQGQSFLLTVHGEEGATKQDGTPLTVAEDAKRKAAQKQSYFSSLGKKLGLNVVTRYFPDGELDADGNASGTPSLRVWHNGERTAEQKAKDAEKAAASGTESDPEQVEQGEGEYVPADDLDLGDE
jgi:hypothetical protein